jgi:hypothetical protein
MFFKGILVLGGGGILIPVMATFRTQSGRDSWSHQSEDQGHSSEADPQPAEHFRAQALDQVQVWCLQGQFREDGSFQW